MTNLFYFRNVMLVPIKQDSMRKMWGLTILSNGHEKMGVTYQNGHFFDIYMLQKKCNIFLLLNGCQWKDMTFASIKVYLLIPWLKKRIVEAKQVFLLDTF